MQIGALSQHVGLGVYDTFGTQHHEEMDPNNQPPREQAVFVLSNAGENGFGEKLESITTDC